MYAIPPSKTLLKAVQPGTGQSILRCQVAMTTTDEDLLSQLASSTDAKVRQLVAENEATPLLVLMLLSRDVNSEVRMALADNPKTPYSVLALLAADPNPDVRYALAENPNLPHSITCYLTEDVNPFVSWRAHLTLSRYFQKGTDYDSTASSIVREVQHRQCQDR